MFLFHPKLFIVHVGAMGNVLGTWEITSVAFSSYRERGPGRNIVETLS